MMCGQITRASVYRSVASSSPADGRESVGAAAAAAGGASWDWGDLHSRDGIGSSKQGQAAYDQDLTNIHDILAVDAAAAGASSAHIAESVMVSVLSPMPVLALSSPTVRVRGIACGQDQFGAVTDANDGRRLFTWGRLHARASMVREPTLVMLPGKVSGVASSVPLRDVQLVAMGMEHAAVITRQSSDSAAAGGRGSCDKLWTWGNGMQGQLGHGDTISVPVPREVTGLGKLVEAHGMVATVAAGNEHTALLFEDGTVHAFGCGWFGRLGLGSEENWARPRAVELGGVEDRVRGLGQEE